MGPGLTERKGINSKSIIRAVVFDFGQTLVDSADAFRAAEKRLQHHIFSDLSLTNREMFLETYRRIRRSLHERSEFSRKILCREVYAGYGKDPDTARLAQWEEQYWEAVTAETREFPETRRVLKTLSKTHRLALITNTQGQRVSGAHRIRRFPKLLRFFETVIIAGDGKMPEKPDPAPFRCCLERLCVRPEAAVYVGDDRRIDICGSRAVGMHPIWLQHRSVKRNWPPSDDSVPIITTLDALLDMDRLIR